MADLHLSVDRTAGGITGQIARELREAVRQGRLAAGERLPASRELAGDLGLSRGVVVEAYEQLVAEGFLISRVGAGTIVAPAASRPSGVDTRDPLADADKPYYGRRSTSPDLGAFPRGRWLASIRNALATLPADALDYGDPGGVPRLREELAAYLRRVRAAEVGPDDLVIVGGVAQGLNLTVRALAGQLPEGRAGHDLNSFVDRIAHPVPPPAGSGWPSRTRPACASSRCSVGREPTWSRSRWTGRASTSRPWPRPGRERCCSPPPISTPPAWSSPPPPRRADRVGRRDRRDDP